MVFTGKIKKKNGDRERWGMDIFFVFFPEKHQQDLNSSSPSPSLSLPFKIKRTNSSQIHTRVQSTISICALLIFLTLLLFTLSSFEPNNQLTSLHHQYSHAKTRSNTPALNGLGTLYTRGTTAMNDLLLCHVDESVTTKELKLFLRAFHRSSLASNSDLLFIFNSITTPDSFSNVILEEDDLFLKIINRYKAELCNGSKILDFPASFDLTQFVKSGRKVTVKREPIWGLKNKSSNFNLGLHHCGDDIDIESTRISYGSVVGFGVSELDPEDLLSGFVDNDHVPMSLRRWASYPMILGRIRRYYKHVMLVDVKKILLLGDPLGRVKNQSPDSVFLSSVNSRQKTINPAVIMGGVLGVRRLSTAMLAEIVRATMNQQQHYKRKNSSVTESGVLSHLATNELTLKRIRMVTSAESILDASSVGVVNQTMVWRGNNDTNIDSVIMKHICSFPIDSVIYTDC